MNGGFIFGRMGIKQYSQAFWLKNVSQKSSPWPAVHEALQQSWVRFDEAAVLRIESRSAGPCRFSLNRGAGKVAGKVLIVDLHYCFDNLLK